MCRFSRYHSHSECVDSHKMKLLKYDNVNAQVPNIFAKFEHYNLATFLD